MKSAGRKEIARRMTVLLLFVWFGFCVPGYAASKEAARPVASGGRRAS